MNAPAPALAEAAGPETELRWIREIAGGDREAFDRLYRVYQVPLFRYFLRMVGSAETAEELANDVLVAVWGSAGRFRAESKPSTWIFGIAHHKALNALRRKVPAALALDSMEELPHPQEGPDARLSRQGLGQRIQRALQALSAEQREVMQLTFFHGLSYAEIAAIVRCPVNTVKTRMLHARRKLQQVMEDMGLRSETA